MNSFKAVFGGWNRGAPTRSQDGANEVQDFCSVENNESPMEDVPSPESTGVEATFVETERRGQTCQVAGQGILDLFSAQPRYNERSSPAQASRGSWISRSFNDSRHAGFPCSPRDLGGSPEPGQLVPQRVSRPRVEGSKLAISSKDPSVPVPPQNLCCPISMEVMSDPVLVATGHTYERSCIEKWIASGHQTCPLSGQHLRHSELTPNIALRNIIQDWAAVNKVALAPATRRAGPATPTRPPNILTGHSEIVWAIECHNGKIMSASADKCVRVWCSEQRRCTAVLEGHTRPVLSLSVAGATLFSGSYDNSIRAWDLSTAGCIAVLKGHSDAVRALTIAGGRLFSGSYDSTLRAWTLPGHGGGDITCSAVLKKHTGPVRALVGLSGCVFSGSYDHTVCCWGAESLALNGQLVGHTSPVRALAALGNFVFSGSDDNTIRCWNAETLQCTGVLKGHKDNVRVLATTPDHPQYLFSGSWDRTVCVWDTRAQTCVKVLSGHAEAVLALAVSGSMLATGSYDSTVRQWDIGTLECVQVCRGHADAVRVLCAADDRFFSGAYDGTLGIWTCRSV